MAWFRAGSSVAKLAIRRALSQDTSYVPRARIIPSQSRYFHTTVVRPKAQAAPVPRPVPLSKLTDSFLDGTSSVYLEELQRAWEQDPNSVDESWDNFFRNFTGLAATSPGISGQTIQESMNLLLLVRAYQVNGHMKAKLDPLGLEERKSQMFWIQHHMGSLKLIWIESSSLVFGGWLVSWLRIAPCKP